MTIWHAMRGALIRTIMLILIGVSVVVIGLAIDTNGFTRQIPPWLNWYYTHYSSDLQPSGASQ